jgi:hypothetical protein
MSSVVPSDRFAAYVVLCFSRGLCGTELDFQIIFVIVVRGYVSVGGSDEDQQKMTCVVLHSTAQGDFSSTYYDAAYASTQKARSSEKFSAHCTCLSFGSGVLPIGFTYHADKVRRSDCSWTVMPCLYARTFAYVYCSTASSGQIL